MKRNLIIIGILLITLGACKKQVEIERPEFIGEWYSLIDSSGPYNQEIYLTISKNSDATYIYYTGEYDANNKYEGIARANDRHFKIGRTKYFKIIEYPHKIDTNIERHYVQNTKGKQPKLANWKMVLDGMKPGWIHWSGEYKYYKADY